MAVPDNPARARAVYASTIALGQADRPDTTAALAQSFFETMRQHTIAGFLIDPDFGGNDSGAGWKVIGREREHMFQAPFGFYDRDYAGWQPMPKEADKK